jgi:uncharacterized protein YcbX
MNRRFKISDKIEQIVRKAVKLREKIHMEQVRANLVDIALEELGELLEAANRADIRSGEVHFCTCPRSPRRS